MRTCIRSPTNSLDFVWNTTERVVSAVFSSGRSLHLAWFSTRQRQHIRQPNRHHACGIIPIRRESFCLVRWLGVVEPLFTRFPALFADLRTCHAPLTERNRAGGGLFSRNHGVTVIVTEITTQSNARFKQCPAVFPVRDRSIWIISLKPLGLMR
jgi:hypothetical protein